MNKYFDYVPNFGGQAEKLNLFLPKIYELQSLNHIANWLGGGNGSLTNGSNAGQQQLLQVPQQISEQAQMS